MDMTRHWPSQILHDRRSIYIALLFPIVGSAVYNLLNSARRKTKILPSPRHSQIGSIPTTSSDDDLAYPSSALPGARDVPTPFGSIRVYEWGPPDGRKVLFVHGISTPCIAFAGMAKALVERGCRVMLFDLFGRGYSDAPDPGVWRQGMEVWGSQILMVLASSELSWTGPNRFTLIGYSMGGGIGATFTTYFPQLVESLILIAPGGLIRPYHISRSSKLLYGNLLPAFVVNYFVRRRLGGGSSSRKNLSKRDTAVEKSATPTDVAESEVPPHPANARDSEAPIFPGRPGLSIADAVAWQLDSHPGFLPSFISSIQYAPVSQEHERWKTLRKRLDAQRTAKGAREVPGLDEGKVLVILGIEDSVIVADEFEEDVAAVLGKENVEVVRLEGGHDVPVVNSAGCVDAIERFWGNSPV